MVDENPSAAFEKPLPKCLKKPISPCNIVTIVEGELFKFDQSFIFPSH